MAFNSILAFILRLLQRPVRKAGLPVQGVCLAPTVPFKTVVEESSVAAKGKPETLPQNKEKIGFYFPKLLTGLSLFAV